LGTYSDIKNLKIFKELEPKQYLLRASVYSAESGDVMLGKASSGVSVIEIPFVVKEESFLMKYLVWIIVAVAVVAALVVLLVVIRRKPVQTL